MLFLVFSESVILTIPERSLLESHEDINSQKQWKLVYRASSDGDKVKDFHEKCDNLSPVLVVIKSKKFNHVFGGFSHLPFETRYEWIHDKKKRNWLFRVRFDNFF